MWGPLSPAPRVRDTRPYVRLRARKLIAQFSADDFIDDRSVTVVGHYSLDEIYKRARRLLPRMDHIVINGLSASMPSSSAILRRFVPGSCYSTVS